MTEDNPRPTLRLRERTARDCRLRRADVDFLLARCRGVIELVPTYSRGVYRLTPRGKVGVVLAPHRRISIRPKLPLQNLTWLLDPDSLLTPFDDRSGAQPQTELADILALRLADLLTERAVVGLHRGYVERNDEQAFLRGRLDVSAQMREPPARQTQFHVTCEEFTADAPWNQLPKAAAAALSGAGVLSPPVGQRLRAAAQPFRDFGPISVNSLGGVNVAALPAEYRPLLDLSGLILRAYGPSGAGGPEPFPGFLIDLEQVFERFVTRRLVSALTGREGISVDSQAERRFLATTGAAPPLVLKPDILVRKEDCLIAVVDAKWKRLAGASQAEDAEQVLAYGAALGCGDVRLVYPGRKYRTICYPTRTGGITLTVHSLAVAADRAALERSVRRLAAELLRAG